jgi:hypothetical protein
MKFTIRQLAVFVLFVVLVLALVLSRWRNAHLAEENRRLRNAQWYSLDDEDQDKYLHAIMGYHNWQDTPTWYGSHLLQVENHERYAIEATFYDGATKQRKTETVDLGDPLIAITHVPRTSESTFCIQSTHLVNADTRLDFEVNTHKRRFFNPHGGGGQITDRCFLLYFFIPPDSVDSPSSRATDLDLMTPEHIIELCDKYRHQSVFFRIVPRE